MVRYLEYLRDGDRRNANLLCAEGFGLYDQTPPAITELAVYPTMRNIAVTKVEALPTGMRVTASVTAVDLETPIRESIEEAPPEEQTALYDLLTILNGGGYQSLYQPTHDLDARTAVSLYRWGSKRAAENDLPLRAWEVPFLVCQQETGEWLIQLEASACLWPEGGAHIQPLSWSQITYDYAFTRYYAMDAYYAQLNAPNSAGYETIRKRTSVNELFQILNSQVWNVWLRLTGAGFCERLFDFSVEGGGGSCAAMPVAYTERYMTLIDRGWTAVEGIQRGVLELAIPATDGQPLGNLSLRFREHVNPWSPMYYEAERSLSLAGTPCASAVPEGGVTAAVKRISRVQDPESPGSATLRQLMTNGHVSGYLPVFPDAPDEALDLPLENDEYALYRVEGTLSKQPGAFGVYDVTFGLETPVDGVWVETYQQCGSCDEIDGLDIRGRDSGVMDKGGQRDFDIQLLIRIGRRTPDELDAFVRALPLTIAFSGEKWNFSYEQHLTTTRIGPRTILPVKTGV